MFLFWSSLFELCCCRLVTQSCDPMDCSPLGSSVHGIFQERILDQVAVFLPTQKSNPCLLDWQEDSLPLCYLQAVCIPASCLYLCRKNSSLLLPNLFGLKWRTVLGELSSVDPCKGSGFSQCHFRLGFIYGIWNCEDPLRVGVNKTALSFGLRKMWLQILTAIC